MRFLIQPIALAIAQLAAFTAAAQSSAGAQRSAPAPTLQTLVVTAQQREQRQTDVPIFMNTLSADEIDKRGITDLLKLSYAIPEMITVVTGMAQNRVTLRGSGDTAATFRSSVSTWTRSRSTARSAGRSTTVSPGAA